jgi:hypothetical protein
LLSWFFFLVFITRFFSGRHDIAEILLKVALKEEGSSKKLTITAPNAKGEAPKEDAPLEEKIKYTIAAEVNPQLASHGGFVDLVEITKDMDVILNFGSINASKPLYSNLK